MTWYPIGTAPKDGTLIDLWLTYESNPSGRGTPHREPDARWVDGKGWVRRIEDGDYAGDDEGLEFHIVYHDGIETFTSRVTHWMPIPQEPGGDTSWLWESEPGECEYLKENSPDFPQITRDISKG